MHLTVYDSRIVGKMIMNKHFSRIICPFHKEDFLNRVAKNRSLSLLDVGCGNNSVQVIREICDGKGNRLHYTGLDIGDYYLNNNAKQEMDEYVVVESSKIADAILRWECSQDVVISANNLEHCDHPDEVLVNMVRALKVGGQMYISFSSEASVNFPSGFDGALNFYDDASHQHFPSFDGVLKTLTDNGMIIEYKNARYRPLMPSIVGAITWPYARKKKIVAWGIWQLFGFESIIWAKKEKQI